MKAFIIMPFIRELDPVYFDVISPACNRHGLDAIRADQILDPGSIPEQIVRSIEDSLFVVAEVSRQNDNVFYELGYAHALHKRAILLSERDRHLPFDVRVTRTLIYDRAIQGWQKLLTGALDSAIGHLYTLSERLLLENLRAGQEFEGHMHTIFGQIFRAEFSQHLWCFARREDLDTWWPQDNGEIRVRRDGGWRAQLFLGENKRDVDVDRFYDVKFGLLDTSDNRILAEMAVEAKLRDRYPGLRNLPQSFEELAHVKVKRILR